MFAVDDRRQKRNRKKENVLTAKHPALDRTTRYTVIDTHRKEQGSNGKCDCKHTLVDTHQKKKYKR